MSSTGEEIGRSGQIVLHLTLFLRPLVGPQHLEHGAQAVTAPLGTSIVECPAQDSVGPHPDLKGPKTPMHGRLRENRQECGARGDVRGGVVDPEEPFIRQAKFLPI